MVADARLRDGIPDAAIDILKPAYAAQPANDDIARRLGMALRDDHALRRGDAGARRLPRRGTPPTRGCCWRRSSSQYELVQGGQVLSVADAAKMRRYAGAYKGPEAALVQKYLESMQAK